MCEKVVGVSMSDTVMEIVMIYEDNVLRLICWNIPQSYKRLEEK